MPWNLDEKNLERNLISQHEDTQLLLQTKHQDKSVLNNVLQRWQNVGEELQAPHRILTSTNLSNIADLLRSTQCSDHDLRWLK